MSLSNTKYGIDALTANTTGINNTAIGSYATLTNTSGESDVSLGTNALLKNTTGNYNTALGTAAMCFNTEGSLNTGVGSNALENNTSGSNNTALGAQALFGEAGSTCSNNTAVGTYSLLNNVTDNNTAVGSNALFANTSGINNTAVGMNSSNFNVTGHYNASFGASALKYNKADFNTAIGAQALTFNKEGNNNTALGWRALSGGTDSSSNTAVGAYALYGGGLNNSIQGSQNNTAVGTNALKNNITGSDNTALGNDCNNGTTGGNWTTAIGAQTNTNNYSYSTVIGYNSTATANHQVMLGTVDETVIAPGNMQINKQLSVRYIGSGDSLSSGTGGINLYGKTIGISSKNGNSILIQANNPTSTNNVMTFETQSNSGADTHVIKFSAGEFQINPTTTSTTTSSGALQVAGGVGIGGNLNVGGTMYGNVAGTSYTNLGLNNVAVGSSALITNTTGTYNTAIGNNTLEGNTAGTNNTALGYKAGLSGNFNNSTAIGYNSNATGNNQVVLGTTAEKVIIPGTAGSTGTTSGALQVAGGVGIMENLNVGGIMSFYNSTIGSKPFTITNTGTSSGSVTLALNQYSNTSASADMTLQAFNNYPNTYRVSNINLITNSSVNIQKAGTTGSYPFYENGGNLNVAGGVKISSTSGSTGTTSGALQVAGGVGIMENLNVGGNLNVVGTINGTVVGPSDARDKTNFKELDAGLNFITKLEPLSYDWNKRDGTLQGKKDIGFKAQDLLQVQEDLKQEIPGLVHTEDPENLKVSYMQLITVLVKSVQELKAEVDGLKEEVNNLKK
jgi:hypothetical protein